MKKLLFLFALSVSLFLTPDACKAQVISTWTLADSVQTIYITQTVQSNGAFQSWKLNKAGLSFSQSSYGGVSVTGSSVTGIGVQLFFNYGTDSVKAPGITTFANSNALFAYLNSLIMTGYIPVTYNAAGAHILKTKAGIIAGVFIDSAGTGTGTGTGAKVAIWDGPDSLSSHSTRIFSGPTTAVGQFVLNANCLHGITVKLYGTTPGRLTFTYR